MLHIPIGSIGQDETPDTAVFASIQARIGISSNELSIIRKLGIVQYFQLSTDEHVERHDFLMALQVPYPLTWKYQNNRYKTPEDLEIQMITPEHLQIINARYRNPINQEQIPELFLA